MYQLPSVLQTENTKKEDRPGDSSGTTSSHSSPAPAEKHPEPTANNCRITTPRHIFCCNPQEKNFGRNMPPPLDFSSEVTYN